MANLRAGSGDQSRVLLLVSGEVVSRSTKVTLHESPPHESCYSGSEQINDVYTLLFSSFNTIVYIYYIYIYI